MRFGGWWRGWSAALFGLCLLPLLLVPAVGRTRTVSTAAAPVFAPYLVIGEAAGDPQAALRWHLHAVTLAFLVGKEGCSIGWDGLDGPLPNDQLADHRHTVGQWVSRYHKAGLKVILSLGGEGSADPAGHCADSRSLAALYQSVIDRYHPDGLDFDVEGEAAKDMSAAMQRDAALLFLRQANPRLTISFTLPVAPSGFVAGNGQEVVAQFKADGYAPDLVNLLTMDYGPDDPAGATMGQLARRAVQSADDQMAALGLRPSLGITPMIGHNDVETEVFSLADSESIVQFARSNGRVRRLAMWSLDRDHACSDQRLGPGDCSGILQDDAAFTKRLRQIESPSP